MFPADDDSSSISPDITDTVELSRRLLEILSKSDPTEAGEELKKLKDELDKRSMFRIQKYFIVILITVHIKMEHLFQQSVGMFIYTHA